MPKLESLAIDQLKNNAHVRFHHLHRLRGLDVRYAQNYDFLTQLPENLLILKSEAFDVNMIESIRHANLQALDFSSFKLGSFDAKILAGLPNLRHLRIKRSALSEIKQGYAYIKNLETLSLERNIIEEIDLSST